MKSILFYLLLFFSFIGYSQSITHEIKMPYNQEFDSIVQVKNIQPNQEIKVYTQYQVDELQNITTIVSKGSDPIFEKEAEFILQRFLKEENNDDEKKEPFKKYASVVIMKIVE